MLIILFNCHKNLIICFRHREIGVPSKWQKWDSNSDILAQFCRQAVINLSGEVSYMFTEELISERGFEG